MNILLKRNLLGGLTIIALGLATLPAGADIIAGDGFNYTPQDASLSGANGGSVSPPATSPLGWITSWSADSTATVGVGLTYSGYGGLGIGNSVTLGSVVSPADIGRGLGDSSSASVVWMRMLYNPGAQVALSVDTATPFQFSTANDASFLNLQRTVGAVGGDEDHIYALNMSGITGATSDPFELTGSGTRMLLFKLTIDQTTLYANETLSLWVNPTSVTEDGLGGATVQISANILEGADDYLAAFSAAGFGDRIDELVLGTSLGDVIGQLNDPITSVPEASGPMMMLLATPLVIGAIWYRRRQSAWAKPA